MKNFGFTSLKELPEIEDIEGIINIEEEPEGMEQITMEEVEYGEREI